ncbi:MAG: beta-lactamase family protein, partial [Anaerolineales bacterium]|nr:beta-lactamase family protein [Anaerolineales bacterium]
MKDLEKMEKLVTGLMNEHLVPGVQIGILYNNEIETFGYGVTNIEYPMTVTDETLFQIGSISKTFTATAIMRLVEMGEIKLDATIRTYLPDFRVVDNDASERATIRHLLTHTAGWFGDFFHDTGPGDDALKRYAADMARLEQLAPVGTLWSYNNAGYYLAGYIIELVTDKKYEDALRELVLDPLGLAHCFFDPGKMMTYPVAVGHG